MKSAFDKLLQYDVRVLCDSPLRTGGTDRNALLCSADGTYFMQGTSLTGALRAWRDDSVLFGTRDCGGELTVSDLVFDDSQMVVRPRVRIDGATGAASDGGLFETAALAAGTTGHFTLTWKGHRDINEVKQPLEAYLAALHCGDIRLGGQKSNGFGRVTLEAALREYDLTDPRDLHAWLEDTKEPVPVTLENAVDRNRIVFRVEAHTEELLIRSAATVRDGDKSYTVPYQENGCYMLPGSSIKGAVRSRMTQIAAVFGQEALVDSWCGTAQESAIAGKLYFSDGKVEGNPQNRIRVRINRFTGGVMNGAAMNYRTLAGTAAWDISLPREEEAACAVLLMALRDLGLGVYTLGGMGSVGVGQFTKMTITAEAVTMVIADGTAKLRDESGMTAAWMKSWEAMSK